ncbi:MAG: thiamine biosynthesis protein ThiF [Syntrophaceae bacterium]|nr:thiamine biosynthesis protein ThiF [Syntrophaceae bacterium]
MQDFLDRTFPLLEKEGVEALSTALIAFAGLGGVGGGAFLNLVRCGVKRFRLSENGVFDPPDMNRQVAAFASTMGQPKIEVYERLAREINPEVQLELFPEGTTVGNLEQFLDGCDVYVGVIDVEKGADVKAMTPELLMRFNIPLFTAGAFGFGALLVAHHPDGMMPDEFWGLLKKKSNMGGFFPSFVSDKFEPTTMKRLENAARTGKLATTSIGGSVSGALLASEVLAYLLRDTDLVNRDIIFAPKFVTVCLLRMAMEVVDITEK